MEALFRYRQFIQSILSKVFHIGTNAFSPSDHSSWIPLSILSVVGWHVFSNSGKLAPWIVDFRVYSHSPVVMKNLNNATVVTHHDLLLQQFIRHTVALGINLHMVIKSHCSLFETAHLISLIWKWLEILLFFFMKLLSATGNFLELLVI